MLVHFDRCDIFAQNFDHIWPAILYRAQSCAAGQRAHDFERLNEVYKAYMINHILYNKFLGPPPLDLTLIWKLGPVGLRDCFFKFQNFTVDSAESASTYYMGLIKINTMYDVLSVQVCECVCFGKLLVVRYLAKLYQKPTETHTLKGITPYY